MNTYRESCLDILCLYFLTSQPLFNQLPPLPALLWNSGPKSNLRPPNYQILTVLLLKLLVTLSLKLSDKYPSVMQDSCFSFCSFTVSFMCLTSSVGFPKVLSSSLLIPFHTVSLTTLFHTMGICQKCKFRRQGFGAGDSMDAGTAHRPPWWVPWWMPGRGSGWRLEGLEGGQSPSKFRAGTTCVLFTSTPSSVPSL